MAEGCGETMLHSSGPGDAFLPRIREATLWTWGSSKGRKVTYDDHWGTPEKYYVHELLNGKKLPMVIGAKNI